jgi:iron complex transport system substrate-binding protein
MPVTSDRLRAALTLVLGLVVGGAAHATVTVRDDSGRDVRLERPALRIISLAPHITELLYEVGSGDRVVGATAYSDYPTAASKLPRVGGLAGIDIERVIALKPDLVIAWQSGTSQAQLELIERVGIPVFRSEPHTLDDVATSMERFGVLSGRVDRGRQVATAFRARVEELRDRYARRAPVRVFYQVWNDPLMTIGGTQLTTQVIDLCGGHNIFASLTTLAPIVDVEAVIAADPQLIATTSESADHRRDLAIWSRWTGVSAVREKRYLFLEPALISRHTSRILIGAQTMCDAIDAARSR